MSERDIRDRVSERYGSLVSETQQVATRAGCDRPGRNIDAGDRDGSPAHLRLRD